MGNVIEKLGSYQIMTNLLPGAFFGIAAKSLFGMPLPAANIAEEILIFYFAGLIINRIGSLVIRPILKKVKIIQEAPYADYMKAAKADMKLDVLSETNNYFRSVLTCFLLLPVVGIMRVLVMDVGWIGKNWKGCAVIFLAVLFLFSYKKQTDIVRKRVEGINNQQ